MNYFFHRFIPLASRQFPIRLPYSHSISRIHSSTPSSRAMTTLPLPRIYNNVPLIIPSHVCAKQDEILEFPAFKSWISRLTSALRPENNPAGYNLRSIEITNVVRFSSDKLGFVMLNALVKDAENEVSLPGAVLLRGPSVAILALLHPKNTPKDNLYAILTIQPRLPGASTSLAEIPAGMLDDQGSFVSAAAKELEEEVGIKISEDKLINLSELALEGSPLLNQGSGNESVGLGNAPPVGMDKPDQKLDGIFSSAGLLDEIITYHAFVHEIPEEELDLWKGKLTGLRDKGERITLKLVKFDELWKATRDSMALCAWALWKGLEAEGRLPY
ncbi:hypothetical protein AA313_de0203141 [Arthrobotrys entomopaga]|nr:hypothetical protein AA313_de0203141 [Arthrobotrys entomopaga]